MIVALDLDGTLITAEQKQSCLLKAAADRYGVSLKPQDIWGEKRAGSNNFAALQQLGVNDVLASAICLAWLRDIETPYWLSLDTLFGDTQAALGELGASGFQLILLTARQNAHLMKQQVFRLDLAKHFVDIFCVAPKSAAADKAQVLRRSKAIAFFGDSESDFRAATEAKLPFYGVATGQRSESFLMGQGVKIVDCSLGNAVRNFLGGFV